MPNIPTLKKTAERDMKESTHTKKSGRLWSERPFKGSRDAVIVGGGLHGLAAAYFLASRHNMHDVAVLEKRYVGYGGAGRNAGIVRANQRTKQNLPLYKEALEMWPALTRELDYNLMFHNCGNLNLAHSEKTLRAFHMHAATAQFHGVDIRLLSPRECKELEPALDISDRPRMPVFGGMFHPQGGVVRHDAVVWGLAKAAHRLGVSIHQGTEATGIRVIDGKVAGVETDRGTILASMVLNAAGGYSAAVYRRFFGKRLPITVLGLQAMVTEPLKPLLQRVVSSGDYRVYANQSIKGEVVTGGHMDHWPNFAVGTTASYMKKTAESIADILPCLVGVNFMRAWGGLADMTPDMAPIMDGNVPAEGFFLDCGWGYFGFKSSVAAGKYMAEFMASGKRPETIKPFALNRFENHRPMGETAAPMEYSAYN